MSEPKRYSFWGVVVHLPNGGVRPEVHFKVDEDGLFVGYPDYEKLKAENERLRKAGDAMAKAIKWLPQSISDRHLDAWNAAKEGKQS